MSQLSAPEYCRGVGKNNICIAIPEVGSIMDPTKCQMCRLSKGFGLVNVTRKTAGLGDVVAGIMKWTGIRWLFSKTGLSCRCNARIAWLNRLWSWNVAS